jgi:AmiR/NasT family two-component response regulator
VLDELRQRIEVSEPTRTDRANCYQLGDDELDELIAQLIRSGDNTEAIELLVRRRGCSTTEAHKLVKEQATQI